MAPGATNIGSVEVWMAAAHTALVSRECCQVARSAPASSEFALRKCVVICLPSSLNNVAWGP